ncbi:hypothetical protein FHJ31_07925 [Pseudomonas sp. Fig-3]|uniref:DUF3077 domain-containing protein n=1 Tax=Pseudomonas rhizophila TaxID=2045200 RepID=A0ABN5JPT5_9PSED|nr:MULTISPECIES: DUF6124 family protein [Pseudomonas]AVU75196.1 hypothetical protein CRX69_08275 [Pseudomonas rhizophila]MBD0702226.1 hypothetical protein [Pseudomonas sp. PSB1]MDR8384943.1 DUF6124 family protein [Pseudomonas sp. JL2]TNB86798.1 hypothetical protein FHJ31_07925 [Pseudomonas sp. Fig-3]
MNEGKTEPNFNRTNPLADFDSIEDLLKDRAAAERALNHYLNPKKPEPSTDPRIDSLFSVTAEADADTLLTSTSETLASIKAMAEDLAFEVEGTRRSVALGIHQLVELCQLLVDKALDQLEVPASPAP